MAGMLYLLQDDVSMLYLFQNNVLDGYFRTAIVGQSPGNQYDFLIIK